SRRTNAPAASTSSVGCTRFGSPTAAATRRSCPTCSTSGSRLHRHPLLQAENRAGDHEALDLARPLVDLRDLRVAVVTLDRELLRVAVAAEDLDRLARLAPRHLRGEQLRLRSRLGVSPLVLLQPRRAMDEQPGRVDLYRHV